MTIVIRDPGSAITHYIAMMMAVFASVPLLLKAGLTSGVLSFVSMAVFICSMILLYGASTAYHTVNVSARALKIFRKFDHMMIFILIAGTYTPVCLLPLRGPVGIRLLLAVWGIAAAGILIKLFWITCPKWFSSILYIAMGWACISVMDELWAALSHAAFGWLLAGGIIYTVGGIIYALKLPLFNARHRYFGSHEIFHLFVMGGSICHFIFRFKHLA